MSLLTQASLVLTPTAYKANKLYSVVPSSGNGDMVTTRATTATRVNSSGLVENVATGIPRLDYSNGTASLLLEPQRTNICTHSEDFTNFNYVLGGTATLNSNTTNSPSNTITADTLSGASSIDWSTGNVLKRNIVVLASTTYTFSIYVKSLGSTTFSISLRENSITGAAIVNNYTINSNWTRISIPYTTTASQTALGIIFGNTNGDVAIWGSQLEVGSYATSYISTTTSTVTRNADLASVSGVSSLIGQTEGVMFIESAALANDLTLRVVSISDGTNNNRLGIYYNSVSNQILCFGVANGTNFTSAIAYTITDETQFAKIAIRYRVNDFSLWVNGIKRGTDLTSQALPLSFNRFGFDAFSSNNANFNSKVKSAQLYKTYLTDAEMASLTTL